MKDRVTAMRIFLDDDRNPPLGEEDWVVVRTPDALLRLAEEHSAEIQEISFDNDLRCELEGRDAMRRLLGGPVTAPMPLPALRRITVHSANETAAQAMLRYALAAIRGGDLQEIELRRRAPNGSFYPLADEDDRALTVIAF